MIVPRRIVIVDGHPDADRTRFVHALADAYAGGASEAGHAIRRAQDQQAITWAQHIVLLYPLWLGDMPALLKALLEQVARPGFAMRESPRGPIGLLKGRSARIIVTMGMRAFFYRFLFGAHSVKSLERSVFRLVGNRPVEISLIGAVDASAEQRAEWLGRIADRGGERR